jgi:hypothetical protein
MHTIIAQFIIDIMNVTILTLFPYGSPHRASLCLDYYPLIILSKSLVSLKVFIMELSRFFFYPTHSLYNSD